MNRFAGVKLWLGLAAATAIGSAAIDVAVSSRDSAPGWLAMTLETLLPAAAVLNRAFELNGRPGDFRGTGGMVIVFEIVLIEALLICAIGAFAGRALGRRFNQSPLVRRG